MRDGTVDLLLQPLGSGERRQRCDAVGVCEYGRGEFLDELVVEVVCDDEPLGGVAGLPGVVDPRRDASLDNRVDVVGGKQDERSEPPSSSTTFFRSRPATSATAAPARWEPVSDTPATRWSAMMAAACSLVA